MWSRRLGKVLFILSGALLLAAASTFLIIYNEGNIAAENAKKLLVEYEKEMNTTSIPTTAETPNGTSLTETDTSPTPALTPENYEGYQVIGKLVIDKISAELPVISEMSTTALKVSCCYYQGAMPGEQGNMVITGHDYANGAIFGRLGEVKTGDTIVLSTLLGDFTYNVYETKIIRPDDIAALDEYQGDRALTLMTCTSNGNRRLLVRCMLTSTG